MSYSTGFIVEIKDSIGVVKMFNGLLLSFSAEDIFKYSLPFVVGDYVSFYHDKGNRAVNVMFQNTAKEYRDWENQYNKRQNLTLKA